MENKKTIEKECEILEKEILEKLTLLLDKGGDRDVSYNKERVGTVVIGVTGSGFHCQILAKNEPEHVMGGIIQEWFSQNSDNLGDYLVKTMKELME